MNIVDVLYSLVDVNQRFDRLVLDPLIIRNLNMTIRTFESLYDQTFSIDDKTLSRICDKILCRIYDQINTLTIEQYSVERILRVANYPQLYSLSFINFEGEILDQYLTDDSILRDLLSKQITHLNIDIKNANRESFKITSKIFVLILSLCKNLIDLNFCDLFFERKHWNRISRLTETSLMSSTLTKLKINLVSFTECLFLLNGNFECLTTLILHVETIYHPIRHIDKTKKLPKLKYFSFISPEYTSQHDILIFPFIRRMINLEELKLYLLIEVIDLNYIDGIQLYDELLCHMKKLNNFTFNIQTRVFRCNTKINLSSNEDIQRSFIEREIYQQNASYIHNLSRMESKCHIYSLPYQFEYLLEINNSFPGGIFHTVRYLVVIDQYPFEHKFFQFISHSLPFLEILHIRNDKPQKDKQYSSTELITFHHLKLLNLKLAHVNYAEQFLLKKVIYLPHLFNLYIKYESLIMITNNFTIDTTYFNFSRVKDLDLDQSFLSSANFHQYFPLL
ncbi:unnamed protein product [Rotaria sordida]|uniref:Uncharacterized protein n=1 Tax=Rotaria sordida TaxID=392033 RepID=A0A813WHU7_9BILA|nr:unnamed protein product [Rotaria sordida]CAF0899907.1 unnamed protein product [Rotaria sordida]CAF3819866.1 unnamed protein product [Rotaria sordida]CAF3837401.1 unnamed protein product [Rotaria sordida]